MKTFKEETKEESLVSIFELKLEMDPNTFDKEEYLEWYKAALFQHKKLLIEKFREIVGEGIDSRCKSEECKTASYPICRHSQGYNDHVQECLNELDKL